MGYDGAGRPTSTTWTDAGGQSWTQTVHYDPVGRVDWREDPRGGRMSFGYDALGQLTSVTDKLGRTSSTTYDDAGRPITSTNRAGETVTMAYNTAGQLVSMTGPGVSRTFTYDALGRLTSGDTGEGFSVDNTWGPRGITAITQSGPAPFPTATWTLAYDEAAHPTHVVGPVVDGDTVQDVTYTWDDFGHLDTLTESTLGTFTFLWDAAGRPLWLERPGDAPTTYHDIDLADRHTRIRTGQLHVLSYAYDALGRLSELRDHEGTHTLQRDAHHRLTGVDRADGSSRPDESYTYDDADRRTAWTAHDAAEVVYDAGDRLTQDAVYTYTYDDEGRRIARTRRSSGATETYVWDALDQLVSRTDEAGTTWTHHYDAFGRRVGVKAVSSGGLTTYEASFVYDTNNLVRAVYDGVGELTASYVTGMDFGQVLAEVDGATGDVRYALLDKQNSLVGWLDAETDEVAHVLRDAFGQRTGDPLTAVAPYGYTGHAEDPGGLVWGRARYLDPATGQWLSEDPVFTESRYAYAANAPLSMTDPTGTVGIGYSLVKELDVQILARLGPMVTAFSRSVAVSAAIIVAAVEFQQSHPDWYLTDDGRTFLTATVAVPAFVGLASLTFRAPGAGAPTMAGVFAGLGPFLMMEDAFANDPAKIRETVRSAFETEEDKPEVTILPQFNEQYCSSGWVPQDTIAITKSRPLAQNETSADLCGESYPDTTASVPVPDLNIGISCEEFQIGTSSGLPPTNADIGCSFFARRIGVEARDVSDIVIAPRIGIAMVPSGLLGGTSTDPASGAPVGWPTDRLFDFDGSANTRGWDCSLPHEHEQEHADVIKSIWTSTDGLFDDRLVQSSNEPLFPALPARVRSPIVASTPSALPPPSSVWGFVEESYLVFGQVEVPPLTDREYILDKQRFFERDVTNQVKPIVEYVMEVASFVSDAKVHQPEFFDDGRICVGPSTDEVGEVLVDDEVYDLATPEGSQEVVYKQVSPGSPFPSPPILPGPLSP